MKSSGEKHKEFLEVDDHLNLIPIAVRLTTSNDKKYKAYGTKAQREILRTLLKAILVHKNTIW